MERGEEEERKRVEKKGTNKIKKKGEKSKKQ